MPRNKAWSRNELLVAFSLYCQLPFGKLHSGNPDIISYSKLLGRTPSALAMKLTNIASLDPIILSSGRKGLSGASSADRAMWEEMQSDWAAFVSASVEAISKFDQSPEISASLAEEADPKDYSGREKDISIKARVGQAFFRKSVLSAYDYRCCISGLSIPSLIVASHIVPWRIDEKNRLNPKNGLPLSMLHDRAFDLGLITIDSNLKVKLSEIEVAKDDVFFREALEKYHDVQIRIPEKFGPDEGFLAYHRAHIFLG